MYTIVKGVSHMDFKERLKELRTTRGYSQVSLADALGVSKSIIGAYETGDRMPSREALEALADFFNVDIDYLLGKQDISLYFLRPEVAYKAQEIYEDPDTRILLDAKRDLSPEDLDVVLNMIKALKAKEGK